MKRLLYVLPILFFLMLAPFAIDAEAKKSEGNSVTKTLAKNVCGDKLCDAPMTMKEKIELFLRQSQISVGTEKRFSISGVMTQSIDISPSRDRINPENLRVQFEIKQHTDGSQSLQLKTFAPEIGPVKHVFYQVEITDTSNNEIVYSSDVIPPRQNGMSPPIEVHYPSSGEYEHKITISQIGKTIFQPAIEKSFTKSISLTKETGVDLRLRITPAETNEIPATSSSPHLKFNIEIKNIGNEIPEDGTNVVFSTLTKQELTIVHENERDVSHAHSQYEVELESLPPGSSESFEVFVGTSDSEIEYMSSYTRPGTKIWEVEVQNDDDVFLNNNEKTFSYSLLKVMPDIDGDGVEDNIDKCPKVHEIPNGFQDEDGCPDIDPNRDQDGDGIINSSDSCVTEPETFNDYKDEDGCPDEIPMGALDIAFTSQCYDSRDTLRLTITDEKSGLEGKESVQVLIGRHDMSQSEFLPVILDANTHRPSEFSGSFDLTNIYSSEVYVINTIYNKNELHPNDSKVVVIDVKYTTLSSPHERLMVSCQNLERYNNFVIGTSSNDNLVGTSGDDLIIGLEGNDQIFGNGGHDVIFGGKGLDTIEGNTGNDRISGGSENDIIYGGDGDDKIFGEEGDERIEGGNGDDIINLGPGFDVGVGDDGDDQIYGYDGNDEIAGRNGDDVIDGGNGNDLLYGQRDNDRLFGQDGFDILYGGSGDDDLYPGLNSDFSFGNSGNDLIVEDDNTRKDIENFLYGGDGDDDLYGGPGYDHLDGQDGDDYLDGGEGTNLCANGEKHNCVTLVGRPDPKPLSISDFDLDTWKQTWFYP